MDKQDATRKDAARVPATNNPAVSRSFALRVLTAAIIVAGVVGLLYLLSQVVQLLFFIFGGILFALFLHSITQFITDHTGLWPRVSLACVLFSFVGLFVAAGYLVGPEFSKQAQMLGEQLPQSINAVQTELSKHVWTQQLLKNLPSSGAPARLLSGLRSVFSTTTEGIALVVLSIFVGIYSAADPRLYLESLLHLVPPGSRNRARQIGNRLRRALGWWLVGRIITMTVMAALTMIGLWLINMPMILTLGIISGLFQFVPYLGAFAAAVPAVLIGFLTSPMKALEVAGLYLLIHTVEGYFVTPLIQEYAVALPPAVLIIVQLLMASLFGITGVIFATPVAVAVIVLVQTIYLHDVLEDQVPVLGQRRSPLG
jgi:predicted PurR-regulated permease PerM